MLGSLWLAKQSISVYFGKIGLHILTKLSNIIAYNFWSNNHTMAVMPHRNMNKTISSRPPTTATARTTRSWNWRIWTLNIILMKKRKKKHWRRRSITYLCCWKLQAQGKKKKNNTKLSHRLNLTEENKLLVKLVEEN